ncbi:MAG TPA: caspase family protein [Xanthobacteraceae bacterium]|nr:caspase family protein [Xanthobacteraceae bacterium]
MNARSLFVTVLAVAVIAVGAPVAAQQSDGTKIALLIGNANYPDADAPLKPPVTDARALADELRRNGFETDVAENLTKEAMQRAIERLYGKVKPGSAVAFFFSGYGIQTGRQSYLIPVNAQIWTEAEVRRDGFGIDTVLAELNARGASVKLAILDASRRNPFERRFRGVSTGLAPVTVPRGTLVISATAPGTVVTDDDTENSMFVRELLKEMRSPGLMVEEIFNRTRIGVSRVSRGEQVPWISSSLVEDFYLGKAPAAQASVDLRPLQIEPRPPQVEPRPPREFDADVRRDYDFAERLATRKGWEDFLAKYKSGSYAEMARDKLARLDAPRPPPAPPPPPKPEVKPEPKPGPTAKVEPTPPPPPPTEPLVEELDHQIAQDPNNPDSYFKRGLAHAQKGRYMDAIRDFDHTIRLNPKDSEAFNNRCWARAIIGDLQVALRDCNESLRLKPNFVDALDSRGLVNLKIGLPGSAIADYNAALKLNPKHASALFGRGKAKLRNGDTTGGNADIAAAKAINQDIAREFEDYGIK